MNRPSSTGSWTSFENFVMEPDVQGREDSSEWGRQINIRIYEERSNTGLLVKYFRVLKALHDADFLNPSHHHLLP